MGKRHHGTSVRRLQQYRTTRGAFCGKVCGLPQEQAQQHGSAGSVWSTILLCVRMSTRDGPTVTPEVDPSRGPRLPGRGQGAVTGCGPLTGNPTGRVQRDQVSAMPVPGLLRARWRFRQRDSRSAGPSLILLISLLTDESVERRGSNPLSADSCQRQPNGCHGSRR